MSETIKLVAMVSRLPSDDAARDDEALSAQTWDALVEQGQLAKREHDEMRSTLARVTRERDDAVAAERMVSEKWASAEERLTDALARAGSWRVRAGTSVAWASDYLRQRDHARFMSAGWKRLAVTHRAQNLEGAGWEGAYRDRWLRAESERDAMKARATAAESALALTEASLREELRRVREDLAVSEREAEGVREAALREAAEVAERARAEIRKAAERADERDDPMWAMGLGAQHSAAEDIRDRILALVNPAAGREGES